MTYCRDIDRDMSNAPKALEKWEHAAAMLKRAHKEGIRQMMKSDTDQEMVLLNAGLI